MKHVRTTVYKTTGEDLTVRLTPRAARHLQRTLHLAFYNKQGRPVQPKGKFEIHNESGVCLWTFPANELLPVIKMEDVDED